MKIEKTPYGTYRVRKMIEGVSVSVNFDHKPREAEIMAELMDKFAQTKANPKPKRNMTIEEAILAYAEYKKSKLSVTTYKEYKRLPKRLSKAFLGTLLNEVDQFTIDNEIERLNAQKTRCGGTLKPKTVNNYINMAMAAIQKYFPKLDVSREMLPEETPTLEEPYVPTKEEMIQILEYTNKNDPMFYVPIALAALCGLRRSEIASLKVEDIDENYNLHIDSAVVQDEDNEWVEQDKTKTIASTRLVPIPKPLALRIISQGYVYNGNPHSIGKALQRIQREMGFPTCSLHKLRHFYATELADNGIQEADILYLGGWSKKSDVMKSIYRHARIKDDKNRRAKIVEQFSSSFFIQDKTKNPN